MIPPVGLNQCRRLPVQIPVEEVGISALEVLLGTGDYFILN